MPELEFITFACTDPDELAAFWETVLDCERRGLPESVDSVILERPGERADLLFKDLPRGTDRGLPIHLDLTVEDREDAVERLREAGATVRETKTETFDGHTHVWTILEDPVGNGFCVSGRH